MLNWTSGPTSRPPSLTAVAPTVKNRAARPERPVRAREARLVHPIRKARIPEEIATRIRTLILDGTFRPGRPLPSERTLADRFGVSRGSVRDAFRMLETLGLLESRHGQGTFPHELSVDRLVTPLASVLTARRDLRDELIDVRRMFEPAVARAAAARATAEDTAFHAAMARATHNRVVVRIMETLNDLLVESRKQSLQQTGRPRRSLAGHEAVVAALRARDAEGAALAMHEHIDQIARFLQGNQNL
jgi:GntR family transcriptional regulator, transcriptional repressor for pyruvate dehydrogenase complex